jgi:hypothetical protein
MLQRAQYARVAAVAAIALLAGTASNAQAELVYGTTLTGQLITWDSATPGTLISGVAVQGLQANEQVVGIDFRPATGELFVLGSFSRLYTMNPNTGVATQVGAGAFTPALNGSTFGFDFNPTVDRIREVSNADQNLRLNPITGGVAATDGTLAYAVGDPNFGVDPDITHAAYTNNFNGAQKTTLYAIDSDRDVLVTINPPNNGVLNTVGPIGLDVTAWGGFDISGVTGVAYAALRDITLNSSTFYTINLATGAATPVGLIDGGVVITAMTVVVPEPASMTALAGVIGLAGLRRKR